MDKQLKEMTLRGVLLGCLITVIFMAANIYLGLKVGLTVASSIPAAVISMGLLRYCKGSNILENNLVQSQASAAGTLSTIIFVLPALILIGYWHQFNYWQTVFICASGGILGVIFTIPLRKVLVIQSQLPYPEGIAAAEILKAGNQKQNLSEEDEAVKGIRMITAGVCVAGFVSFLSDKGLKIINDSAAYWFRIQNAIFQIPFGFSLALLGAGYLIGISVAVTMILGAFVNWHIIVPMLTSMNPMYASQFSNIQEYGTYVWSSKVRMMAAGTIGVGAVWSLILLLIPMLRSLKLSFHKMSKQVDQEIKDTDRDISFKYLMLLFLVAVLVLAMTFYNIIIPLPISLTWVIVLTLTVVLLSVLLGFLVSAACGYMAGLLGTSSSPISIIAILAILIVSFVFLLILNISTELSNSNLKMFFIALSILSSSVVICVASIANDNLQDLKTGYLVGATPAKQQWVLMIGCIAGALILAPVLNMLFLAYGFPGVLPREGMNPNTVLNAPQAILMSVISKGIFSHNIAWNDIQVGVLIGIFVIIIDKILRQISYNQYSLPPLAFGMGIYLPPSTIIPLFVGSLLSWLIRKKFKSKGNYENINQRGILLASGFIVGESIMGIILAIIMVISVYNGGSSEPFALDLWNSWISSLFGFITFLIVVFYFYKKITK